MTRIARLSALIVTLALVGFTADSNTAPVVPADTGGGATVATAAAERPQTTVQDPELRDLLLAPPPGAEYLAESSALESEDAGTDVDPGSYMTDGDFETEASYTHVFLTDLPVEDVVRHYMAAEETSPHYLDMEGVFTDFDWQEIDVQEEPAAPMPPDAMEAMIERYREQGVMSPEEADDLLSEMDLYRRIYPKIEDVTVRSVTFTIEEDREGKDEFRFVEVEVTEPYIDPAIMDVRDGTGILYTVHRMRRVDD